MSDKHPVRAAAIFLTWLLTPIGILYGLLYLEVVAAVLVFIPLMMVVYPHQIMEFGRGNAATPVFTAREAIAAAITQWGLVTVAFAIYTRRLSPWRQALLAPLVITGVGILVLVFTFLCGIDVNIKM